jgi:hypothetical protein
LKTTVEAQIKDERPAEIQPSPMMGTKDFTIKYLDGDKEMINVSDDEDLQAAYDVAHRDLNGNLKFVVELKKVVNKAPVNEISEP